MNKALELGRVATIYNEHLFLIECGLELAYRKLVLPSLVGL